MEQFVSCESHWSNWDSLYTLSEEEITEEDVGEDNRYHCAFCEVSSSRIRK